MPKPTTDSTNKSSASDSAKDGRAALKKVFIFFSTDWLIEKSKIYLFLITFIFFLLPKSPNNNTNSISTLNDKKAGQPNSINSLNNTTNSQNSTTNNSNDINKLDDVGF